MIGIFDSGLGGLTVAKAVMEKLPQYQIIYLGDSARTPYGNRSAETIYKFTCEAVEYLLKRGCRLVIVACNTASAEALRKLQQEWLPRHYSDRKVLGVIRPVAEAAAANTKTGRIGVVGTRGTVNSHAYLRELQALDVELKVFEQPCPLLVPLVEENWLKRGETMKIIRYYLRPLKAKSIDTLILGCTHYPILIKHFKSAAGKNIEVLDSAKIVADKLADYLNRHVEIESVLTKGSNHEFLVTDLNEHFEAVAKTFMGKKIGFKKIDL